MPYIGDLIGYRPVHEPANRAIVHTGAGKARNKILIPRRTWPTPSAIAGAKGRSRCSNCWRATWPDWPARVVEFFTLLGWTQHLNHLRLDRGRTADLRNGDACEIDGPFDPMAHTVDVRRINSAHTPGRYNIPSVGVFVWRLKPYTVGRDYLRRADHLEEPSIVKTPAYCLEEMARNATPSACSVMTHRCFVKPEPETDPTQIAEELNLPVPIRRWAFDRHKEDYYGPEKSIEIWASGWSKHSPPSRCRRQRSFPPI